MPTTPRDAMLRHPHADGFGYPLHRVVAYKDVTLENDLRFLDYEAACGHVDRKTVALYGSPWVSASRCRTGELCEEGCWT